MAQRRTKQLEGDSARSVAQKARRARELSAVSRMADENLTPADEWRTILPEHIEAIKTRIIGGDTLPNICKGLGINAQSFTRHIHGNPELLKEYLDWKSFGSHAMWDRLIGMIDDQAMSAGDKMFAFKVINSYAAKVNRDMYGDHVKVDGTIGIQHVTMPDWSYGQSVEGQIISRDEDPDKEV